jgi:small GTP-binding protein
VAEIKRIALLFVGGGGMGKTALSERLQDGSHTPSKHVMTDGIVMRPFLLDGVTFNTFDFAGQPEYVHTHRLFFTKGALYLAVVDPRRAGETTALETYLQMVTDCAPGAPIVLVATHCDQAGLSAALRSRLEAKWPAICAVHEVDSLSGHGIVELKATLTRVALQQRGTVRKVARSFLLLQEQLDALKQRAGAAFSVSPAEFVRICEQLVGMTDPESIAAALHLFATWGFVYKLSDGSVVLNPALLAKVMACVFTKDPDSLARRDRVVRDGILEHSNASFAAIWGDAECAFPAELYTVRHDAADASAKPAFLELLYTAGLAFEMFDAQGRPMRRSVIPALLPDRPAGVEGAVSAGSLAAAFFPGSESHYVRLSLSCADAVPPTFMPRLLAALCSGGLLAGCWQRGLVFHTKPSPGQEAVETVVVYETGGAIEVLSEGLGTTARSVVLNALVRLKDSDYAASLEFADISLSYDDATLGQRRIVGSIAQPGYVVLGDARVDTRSLAVLLGQQAQAEVAQALAADDAESFGPAGSLASPADSRSATPPPAPTAASKMLAAAAPSTARPLLKQASFLLRSLDASPLSGRDALAKLYAAAVLKNAQRSAEGAGNDFVEVSSRLSDCIPELCQLMNLPPLDVHVLWVLLRNTSDGVVKAYPVSPGGSVDASWVVIDDHALKMPAGVAMGSSDGGDGSGGSNRDAVLAATGLLQLAFALMDVVFPSELEWAPRPVADLGALADAIKLTERRRFTSVGGVVMSKDFELEARGVWLAARSARWPD